MPSSDFLSDLKNMNPHQIKSKVFGKILIKQKFYDLFSNLMVKRVKFWQSGKKFYQTILAVAAAGSQA